MLDLWNLSGRAFAANIRTGQFLQVAGQSSAITETRLWSLLVPVESFIQMMHMTSSIECLELQSDLSFVRESTDPNSASVGEWLAEAFTSNRTLKQLTLRTTVSQLFLQMVMQALSQHPYLQNLSIYWMYYGDGNIDFILRGLDGLFCLCGSNFQNISFIDFIWTEDDFRTLATSLQNNATVTMISFHYCKFIGSFAQYFCSIFQCKSLHHGMTIGSEAIISESENVLANLVQSVFLCLTYASAITMMSSKKLSSLIAISWMKSVKLNVLCQLECQMHFSTYLLDQTQWIMLAYNNNSKTTIACNNYDNKIQFIILSIPSITISWFAIRRILSSWLGRFVYQQQCLMKWFDGITMYSCTSEVTTFHLQLLLTSLILI